MRTIAGYITLTNQMYEELLQIREEERELEQRLRTDPEFAEEWARRVAEHWEDRYD